MGMPVLEATSDLQEVLVRTALLSVPVQWCFCSCSVPSRPLVALLPSSLQLALPKGAAQVSLADKGELKPHCSGSAHSASGAWGG